MSVQTERLQAEIMKYLGLMLNREFPNSKYMDKISIHEVRLTTDKRIAKVYYSIWLQDVNIKNVEEEIKKHSRYLRGLLAKKINTRVMPELSFEYDTALETANRIEDIIKANKQGK
ncbi:ribosome-binding factor A [Spiroplasma sp. TIUS-1]|uniref:30S ribosome-binding factor RbfA n=1 Tax=Spiroplasma sp. TIUS-1 TaxID=216963 RepID=UPI0013987EC1|nr:30S ribosome-binding factor RbfA [Spiroplasma sp. TIUS-1]QHX35954.1 ribosome-binding factor A [Spiroplasma sp. TIUS-1]